MKITNSPYILAIMIIFVASLIIPVNGALFDDSLELQVNGDPNCHAYSIGGADCYDPLNFFYIKTGGTTKITAYKPGFNSEYTPGPFTLQIKDTTGSIVNIRNECIDLNVGDSCEITWNEPGLYFLRNEYNPNFKQMFTSPIELHIYDPDMTQVMKNRANNVDVDAFEDSTSVVDSIGDNYVLTYKMFSYGQTNTILDSSFDVNSNSIIFKITANSDGMLQLVDVPNNVFDVFGKISTARDGSKTYSEISEGQYDSFINIPFPSKSGSVTTIQIFGDNDSLKSKPSTLAPSFEKPSIVTTPSVTGSTIVEVVQGSSVLGCEDTDECWLPSVVTVDVGDTVTWNNVDTASHTVTAGDLVVDPNSVGINYPNGFDSDLFDAGQSFSHTFNSPGTFDYFCMVHPWMTGKVVVKSGSPIKPSPFEEEIRCNPGTILKNGVCVVKGYESVDIQLKQFQKNLQVQIYSLKDNDPNKIDTIFAHLISTGEPYRFGLQESGIDSGLFTQVLVLSEDEFNIPLRVEYQGVSGSGMVQVDSSSVPVIICGPGEVLVDGACIVEQYLDSGGGCLIATAAFGSELAPQVQQLREIRDNILLKTSSGTSFMNGFNSFYYSFSPTIADWERQNPAFKELVKTTITPMIATLSILNHVDIDSEEEMLGYGIGIILMNIGMYFAAPALLIFSLKKKIKSKSGERF